MTIHGKNHLENERSPYLRQHADNPVDWHPWGDEAFSLARAEDRPVILSIGYSTCHWCHVMARESFSDERIAAVMNDHFVSIKLDREERPDIDDIYMTAVTALTGSGGWPLNVFLTPDLEPFFGGTYFPPTQRWGRPGWLELVTAVSNAWSKPEERSKLIASARDLTERLRGGATGPAPEGTPERSLADRCVDAFAQDFDDGRGGFGRAQKFPLPAALRFLLRYSVHSADTPDGGERALLAREMAFETLSAMAKGGIRDHIGGGFHRYATDADWRVPHFEKMLYDNAQILDAYLDGVLAGGDGMFATVAGETADYLLRDLARPGGGFFSAEDADSDIPEESTSADGETGAAAGEGAFYLWDETGIRAVLPPDEADLFVYRYGIEAGGNVSDDPHNAFTGRNIPYMARTIEEVSASHGMTGETVSKLLDDAVLMLREARARRPRPRRDGKILTAWNGLAIGALARAFQVFGDERYRAAAVAAAAFLYDELYDPVSRTLMRRWCDGASGITGMADDHAFLARGLTDLYESTGDTGWLMWAVDLADEFTARFVDGETGAVHLTAEGQDPNLIVRSRAGYDNVEPSPASEAALCLLRLAVITGRDDLRTTAERIISFHAGDMRARPRLHPVMATALLTSLTPPRQVVVMGDIGNPATMALLTEVYRRPKAFTVVLPVDMASRKVIGSMQPAVLSMGMSDGRPTAYLCRDFTCRAPTTDPDELGRMLDGNI